MYQIADNSRIMDTSEHELSDISKFYKNKLLYVWVTMGTRNLIAMLVYLHTNPIITYKNNIEI